jgi:amidase
MQHHDFLLCPVSQALPFDIDQHWVSEIEGVEMPTYLDWMMSCCYITLTGHPAISVPCGFSDEGLPVGLQIVGRHHDDRGVLELAWAFEQATQTWKQRPPVVDNPDAGPNSSGRRDSA